MELAELTTAMVRLYKELFGRGPTKARTDYAGPNIVVSSIQNSLTPAERSMVALDEHQRVREIRMFFQHACERDFTETVEQIAGRKVWSFVSGMDTDHDVATEVFYLEPVQAVSCGEQSHLLGSGAEADRIAGRPVTRLSPLPIYIE
jgi:uncharacterized protein YbcI